MWRAIGYIVCFLANVLSFAACIWLLRKLRSGKRPEARRRKSIFAWQFQSMAIADVFYHVGLGSHSLLGLLFGAWPQIPNVENYACGVAWAVFGPARIISIFHELHLALYCLCIAYRGRKLLSILGRTVPMLWIVGLVAGGVSGVLLPWKWDAKLVICDFKGVETPTLVVVLLCGSLALVAYLLVVLRATCYEEGVKRRTLQRLALYPLNFLSTYVVMMMVTFGTQTLYKPGTFFFLAQFMLSLNGFLNVAIYWGQSQYALQLAKPSFFLTASGLSKARLTSSNPQFVHTGDEESGHSTAHPTLDNTVGPSAVSEVAQRGSTTPNSFVLYQSESRATSIDAQPNDELAQPKQQLDLHITAEDHLEMECDVFGDEEIVVPKESGISIVDINALSRDAEEWQDIEPERYLWH